MLFTFRCSTCKKNLFKTTTISWKNWFGDPKIDINRYCEAVKRNQITSFNPDVDTVRDPKTDLDFLLIFCGEESRKGPMVLLKNGIVFFDLSLSIIIISYAELQDQAVKMEFVKESFARETSKKKKKL